MTQKWEEFELDLMQDPHQPLDQALEKLYRLEPGLKEWKEGREASLTKAKL